jgi:exodeoxyribonuclease-3
MLTAAATLLRRSTAQESASQGRMSVASWNVNSIRARIYHVKGWLSAHQPDVLLLQELKGSEFPEREFKELGYDSAAVTQKAYNGVAVLSRHPVRVINMTLIGDDADSHARFIETRIDDIRIANIYLPNGNPVGSENYAYKLAWMDRLRKQLVLWLDDGVPTVIGGDFNVIPEDIDCHKPSSWVHDALFQPEPRARFRAMLGAGYVDAFRALHPGEPGQFTFWDYFRKAFETNRGIRIDHFLVSPNLASNIEKSEIDRTPRSLERPSDHAPLMLWLK